MEPEYGSGYWLIGYSYATTSDGKWHHTNEAIHQDPTWWLLGVLRRQKGSGERYALTMAIPITKELYDEARGIL